VTFPGTSFEALTRSINSRSRRWNWEVPGDRQVAMRAAVVCEEDGKIVAQPDV